MGELTQRFPTQVSAGATGGAGFETRVKTTQSGAEKRNQQREVGIHEYTISTVKIGADHTAADAFFRKARGRAHSFRFKDWGDFQLVLADSRLVAVDGSTTIFQICKIYGADEPTFEEVRQITRPVAGTVIVKKDGTTLTQAPGAGNYQVNIATGRVTFGTAPGASVLAASCEFDVPCRFDFDVKAAELVFRRPDGGLVVRWDNLRIREVPDE